MFYICQKCGKYRTNPDGSREVMLYDSLADFEADHLWPWHRGELGQIVIRVER